MRLLLTFLTILSLAACNNRSNPSADLQILQNLMATPYSTELVISQKDQSTSIDAVDTNQQKAAQLIITSKAPDITPWLQKNAGNYPGMYLYLLAYRMATEGAPYTEVATWHSIGTYRLAQERVLCKDKHVGQYITVLDMDIWEPTVELYQGDSEFAEAVKNTEIIVREQVFPAIAKWDQENPYKGDPTWFCSSGHAASTDETFPQDQWPQLLSDFKAQFFQAFAPPSTTKR